MLGKLIGGIFGGGGSKLIDSTGGLLATLLGDKKSEVELASEEQRTVLSNYAAEFGFQNNRTWWDSLVDGINRLVRPLFTFGLAYLFGYCVYDPISFAAAMNALQLIPEMLWYMMIAIVAFWFGGKYLQDHRKPKQITPADLAVILDGVHKIEEMKQREQPTDDRTT